MQVCRSARGSVCQGPVRNSTWLSFSTARQRQTPPPSSTSAPTVASVVHHRWLLPAACEWPHSGGVHKSRSRPALRQVLVSYFFQDTPRVWDDELAHLL